MKLGELLQFNDIVIQCHDNPDNKGRLFLFQNSNLSLEELRIARQALANYDYHPDNRFAIVEAQRCDPNILGVISDMLSKWIRWMSVSPIACSMTARGFLSAAVSQRPGRTSWPHMWQRVWVRAAAIFERQAVFCGRIS